MAKLSMMEREKKRAKLIAKYAKVRDALRKTMNNPHVSADERWQAQLSLQKLPRDSAKIRARNRCGLTGRPHGFYRKFGLARNKLREAAMQGQVPGLRKASW